MFKTCNHRISPFFPMIFTPSLLTCYILLNNEVEKFIYLSKHLIYLGIYPGLIWFEYFTGKIRKMNFSLVWSMTQTITSYTEWVLSQDKYVAPDKYLFWSGPFLEQLHNNVRCFLEFSPSWCPQILVKTPYWTFSSCGNTSWISMRKFLQNICLPIDKHNQLMYFLLLLSEKSWLHQYTNFRMLIW